MFLGRPVKLPEWEGNPKRPFRCLNHWWKHTWKQRTGDPSPRKLDSLPTFSGIALLMSTTYSVITYLSTMLPVPYKFRAPSTFCYGQESHEIMSIEQWRITVAQSHSFCTCQRLTSNWSVPRRILDCYSSTAVRSVSQTDHTYRLTDRQTSSLAKDGRKLSECLIWGMHYPSRHAS